MTRAEFVKGFALRSGFSSEWAVLGFMEIEGDRGAVRVAMPCACGAEGCEGWAMLGPTSIDHHLRFDAPEPLRSAYTAAVEGERSGGEAFRRYDGVLFSAEQWAVIVKLIDEADARAEGGAHD